jgi:ABC-type sulfate/molybdate transport systems ATPase subunit
MSIPAIAYRGVAWTPPTRRAALFTGLDLELHAGELAVLTSGLGGGKSSALRLAVGLERPDAGSIAVCGGDPAGMRHRVGYVGSAHGAHGALLANLSLYDNLVLPLRWREDPPPAEVAARAKEALAIFGITDPLPQIAPAYAPTNLRRLVALARAIITAPALLVLDDPAADLDSDSAEELWRHLYDIAQARGLAVLAAATAEPHLPAARILRLSGDGAAVPVTRRFSSESGRLALQPGLRRAPHPDIINAAPRPPP